MARGKEYVVIQWRNPAGKAIEQYIVGPGRTEITRVDDAGEHIKSWELVKPGRRVHMYQPRAGHFQFMDVEQVVKANVFSFKFFRTEEGKYRLVSASARPNSPQYNLQMSDIVAGCREGEGKLQVLAGQVNDIINRSEAKLDQALNSNDLDASILGASCKQEPFKDRTDAIVRSMKKIFGSDRSWTTAKAEAKKGTTGRSVSDQGTYIQCLRYHDLDTHASRIDAALSGYVGAETQRFPWKLECAPSPYKLAGSKWSLWGEYQPNGTAPPTIKIYDQMGSGGKLKPRTGQDPSYEYTFFHEMIHYSLIPDGPLADSIGDCCKQSDPRTPSCKNLDQLVLAQRRKQQLNNQLIDKLGPAEYYRFGDILQRKEGVVGDANLDNFFSRAAAAYAQVETETGCELSSEVSMSIDKCRSAKAKLKSRLRTIIDKSFSDQGIRDTLSVAYDIEKVQNTSTCKKPVASHVDRYSSTFLARLETGWAVVFPVAVADENNNLNRALCSMIQGDPSRFSDLSLPKSDPPGPLAKPLIVDLPIVDDDGAKKAGEKPARGDLSSSGNTGRDAVFDTMPSRSRRRTDYAGGDIERQQRIVQALERTDSRFDQVEKALVSDMASKVLPSARAADLQPPKSTPIKIPDFETVDPLVDRMGAGVKSATRGGNVQEPSSSVLSAPSGESRGGSSDIWQQERSTQFSNEKALGKTPYDTVASEDSDNNVPRANYISSPPPTARSSPANFTPVNGRSKGTGTFAQPVPSAGPAVRSSRSSKADNSEELSADSGEAIAVNGPAREKYGPGGASAQSKNSLGRPDETLETERRQKRKTASLAQNGNHNGIANADDDGTGGNLRKIMSRLQRPFRKVKPELQNQPNVLKSMKSYFIQAIDDEGQVYGSAYPKPGRKLIYDKGLDRLVPVDPSPVGKNP